MTVDLIGAKEVFGAGFILIFNIEMQGTYVLQLCKTWWCWFSPLFFHCRIILLCYRFLNNLDIRLLLQVRNLLLPYAIDLVFQMCFELLVAWHHAPVSTKDWVVERADKPFQKTLVGISRAWIYRHGTSDQGLLLVWHKELGWLQRHEAPNVHLLLHHLLLIIPMSLPVIIILTLFGFIRVVLGE